MLLEGTRSAHFTIEIDIFSICIAAFVFCVCVYVYVVLLSFCFIHHQVKHGILYTTFPARDGALYVSSHLK